VAVPAPPCRAAAVDRRGEAARKDSQEGVAHKIRAARSGRTAAAQGAQDQEDPPEEDREAAQPRLSRRAAVVKG
jgi:hypothetical protein